MHFVAKVFGKNQPAAELPRAVSWLQLSFMSLLYFAFLSTSYNLEIGTKWGGQGFEHEFSPIYAIFSAFFIFIFFLQQGNAENFRALLLTFALLTVYIPAMVYLSFGTPSFRLGLAYLISMLSLVYFSKIRFATLRVKTAPKSLFVAGLLGIILLFMFLLASRVGFGKINFNIYAVYDFRRDVGEAIGENVNRALSLTSKILIPLLLIYAVSIKSNFRFVMIAIALFSIVIIFGYWQHKSALFLPVAVLVLYMYLRQGCAIRRLLLLFLLFSFTLLAEAIFYATQNFSNPGLMNSLLGRRALFVPPLISDYYLDFFLKNEMVYWHALTQHFGASGSGYNLAPPFIIGEAYFGSKEISANVGFIGAGYANAGILGVLVYSIFLGLAIAFISAQAKRLGSVFLFCLTAVVFHTAFVSSDLITTLRSHGMLLLLVVIPLLRRAT